MSHLYRSYSRPLSVVAIAAVLTLCACDSAELPEQPPAERGEMILTPGNATIGVGDTITFTARITSGPDVSTLGYCLSSNKAIAIASVRGGSCIAIGVVAGVTTITAVMSAESVASSALIVRP